MSLATLSIDLIAKLTSFEQGMDRAARISEQQAARIDKAMSGLQKTVEGLGIAAAVAASISSAKAAIDVLDQLDDLAEKYGIAAKDLSAYRYASEVAGTSTEAFAAGLRNLSKSMAAAAGGSKEQAAAFKAIGVSITDSKGKLKSADEVLLDVADRFKTYRDGAGKAAEAQDIFGKSGADLIPLLNRGRDGILALRSEAEKLGAVYGNDLAKAAGDFNDNLKKLELAAEGAKVAIAGSLLPVLVKLSDEMINAKKAYGSLFSAFIDNPAVGAGGPEALTATNEQLEKAQTNLQRLLQLAKEGQSRPLLGGDMVDLAAPIASESEINAVRSQIEKLEQRRKFIELQMQSQSERAAPPADDDRPKRDMPVPDKGTKTGKSDAERAMERALKQYDELISKIKERAELQDLEAQSGEKLSEADKFAVGVRADLAKIEDKLGAARKTNLLAMLDQYTASASKTAADERSLELIRETVKSLGAETLARIDGAKALKDQLEEIGLTHDELDALTITRMRHRAAMEDEALAAAILSNANEASTALMKQNLGLLREQIALREQAAAKTRALREDPAAGVDAALKDYQDQVKAAGTSAYGVVSTGIRGLEDTLTQFFTKGKADWKGYFATIAAEALRVKLLQPAVNSLLGAVGSKGLASFFGFADGAAFDALGVKRFAAGDIFGSPTLFSYGGGKRGVMGEAGPEAVMPLRRGADGKLGVVAQAGGGGTTIHQTYQIDARGADAGVELRIRQAMAQTKNETLALVKLQAAQGGSMSRATGRK